MTLYSTSLQMNPSHSRDNLIVSSPLGLGLGPQHRDGHVNLKFGRRGPAARARAGCPSGLRRR